LVDNHTANPTLMKLKSILKQQSLERLENIRQFWGLLEPVYKKNSSDEDRQLKLVEHLYPRLQMSQYFSSNYDKLSNQERELIAFLVIHGGDLSREEVIERQYGGDEDNYEEEMTNLAEKGFVFEDDLSDEEVAAILVGVPEPYIRFIDLPSYWTGYLGYFLRDLTTPQLKSIGNTKLGINLKSSKKNYLISRIRNHLLDPNKLKKYVQKLDDAQKTLFHQLVAKKGVSIYRELLEIGGNQRRFDHAKADALNELYDGSGLIFVATEGDTKHNHLLMIPRDVQYMVKHDYAEDRRSLDELDTVSIVSRDAHPSVVYDNSNGVLRDLTIFTAYINGNMVRTLANGGIGKNDLKKILPQLSANKTLKYVSFLAQFLISNKYIISVGDVWRVSNTFPRWLEDSKECYTNLFNYWLETNEWNEEFVDGDTVHAEVFPANLVNIAEVRKIVLKSMASTPPERWLQFPAFSETLMPTIDMSIPGRSAATTLEKFNRPMIQIVESVIGECLYWLGMVSLGMKDAKQHEKIGTRANDNANKSARAKGIARKAQDFAFQVTPLGRAVLDSDLDKPKKLFDGQLIDHILMLNYNVENFTVLPSLEIVTPPDLKLRAFYHLNEFAEIKTLDVMSTLLLSRESVRKGMDTGLRAEDILKFMKDGSLQELPETVKHLIHECSSKHGEVSLGFAGGYLIVDDPIMLEEIRNNKRISSSIKDVIAEKVILLNSDVDLKKLGKILYKLGYMPNIDSENVHVTQEGSFHLTFSNEDLYGMMAIMRYVLEAEEEMGQTIAADDARNLLERMRPDAQTYYELNFYADKISKRYAKKFAGTLKKRIDDATSKYKKQVTKLLANQPRSTSKYEFDGPNPAEQAEDIMNMVDFALDNDLELEIVYLKSNQEEASERIEPESFAGGKLYAFNPKRDSYSVYRVNRIKSCTFA
jgi:hypothetical protein